MYLFLVAGIFIAKAVMKASVLEVIVGITCIGVLYVIHLIIDEFRGRMVAERLPWLYTTNPTGIGRQVHEVERNIEGESPVYLVTPDLYNDARNERTIRTVTSNLTRGVTYIYITQDHTQENKINIDIVQRRFPNFGKQVQIHIFNEVFGLIPTYNILVLERASDGLLRVFVQLPVRDPSESRDIRHLWAEADEKLGNQWHARILHMLKECVPLTNPYLSRSET